MEFQSERLRVEDSPEAVADLFYSRGWTDGLPIIPPTLDRVERMLGGCCLPPSHSLGPVVPSLCEATLEKVAVNAVMAGCQPGHLPAVVAALEATMDPAFNLNGVQCTTSATTPMLLFNGPIRRELGIGCGPGALGPGGRSNAVIGRAVRLALMNIGGAIPGEVDKAALGQPGKFTFCFGENEEESPWEPYHLERGFGRDESAVTAIGVTGSMEVRDSSSRSAEGILKTVAHSITPAAFMGTTNAMDGGHPVVVLVPEHAEMIHKAGFSKAGARAWLWENAKIPLDLLSSEVRDNVAGWQRAMGLPRDGYARTARCPEDIVLIVAGGAGSKSAFIPGWGGITHPVTRPVAVDGAVDRALASLRQGLEADGYRLIHRGLLDGLRRFEVIALEGACAECLVPRPLMAQLIADAIGADPARIDVRYP